jgi:hypothetical protein
MKDFAEPQGRVAVLFEELWQGRVLRHVSAKVLRIVEHARLRGLQPREHRSSRRVAQRVLAVSPLESRGTRRQAINFRRLDRRTVAAELWAKVIAQDEEDIQALSSEHARRENEKKRKRRGNHLPKHTLDYQLGVKMFVKLINPTVKQTKPIANGRSC